MEAFMDILKLGTVVSLKKGSQKIMIVSRFPLYNENGKKGYFDYSACFYPTGLVGPAVYFFNHEDIDEIYFEGYEDSSELDFQKKMQEEMKNNVNIKLQVEK